ncbi:hypothetical protein THAOC_33157 [Thalassiosira oceanica]|uniref:Aminotransferase class I/classII large domain-containing protein n=1 Tax=Thalassiosira oceanica TaxID=159749 RepID=K0RMW4_THAOC|nr:hypothetical protein THAOC_33157 [Thalassiosira oceanica]|eukprot:EJK48082.1 hypothetical protein THAOC_33157 [Thalassiosira oceanica]
MPTDAQRQLYASYLATGRGGTELFNSFEGGDDIENAVVLAADIVDFLGSVGREGIRADEFEKIEALATSTSAELFTLSDFLQFLAAATSTLSHRESEVQPRYERHSSTGKRRSLFLKEPPTYSWNEDTMSQSLRRMQYAVRGEVVMLAEELKAEGREIIFTNVGNPHAVGQKCITYYRQVLALCDLPDECGVDHPDVERLFPKDVIARARLYKDAIGTGGTGSYSHSQGVKEFREHVAKFIEARDGHESFAGDIFLTNGASTGIQNILVALMSSDRDAVMIPIPQYPIYSALIALLGGRQVGYMLDEQSSWAVTEEELNSRLDEAKATGLKVKALAIINPGNPTGQVLDRRTLETICKFCAANGIVLLADEVYQRNIYAPGKEFLSAKKIACETKDCEDLQLVSFHSTSKGLIGECGRRGGYMEMHGIDPYVQAQVYKLASSGLCSGMAGQIMTSLSKFPMKSLSAALTPLIPWVPLVVNPPKPGEESYELFTDEESTIFNSLVRRSKLLVDGLNKIEGVTCEPSEGAMYAFPKIELPKGAVAAAEENNQTPDTMYALSLLDETGICVVPASGFGQADGRIGFRTTFLPPEDKLVKAVDEFKRHHELFCQKWN